MYNEEKKIITDIGRKKNLEENLPKYVSCMKSADYEYAVSKFALNFFTVKEMLEDKKEKIEPEIVSFIIGINKLVNTYVAGKCSEVDPKDMLLVSDMRNKVTARMKVLTAYTDAFELYEYILNRKEFGFEENVTEEVEKMFSEYDVDAFSQEIYNFIFADKDKMAVNSKIQSLIGQLPLRMTKNKFYDIIGQTLSIYNGSEIGSLNEFCDMVCDTVLINKPEGFEEFYPELFKAYTELKEYDYTDLSLEDYRRLAAVLDSAATYINDTVSDYMMLIELINDMYTMLLVNDARNSIGDDYKKAIDVIASIAASVDKDTAMDDDTYELLSGLVGLQEQAGEYKMLPEASFYDIVTGNSVQIEQCGLDSDFKDLEAVNKLLSGSLFADIDNVSGYNTMPADTETIVAFKDKLCEGFAGLFEENKMIVNRAIMAKALSNIPVFFNTTEEIKEYIEHSLAHCSNRGEQIACYSVIRGIMED